MSRTQAHTWAALLLADLARVMEAGGDAETCRVCILEMFREYGQRVHEDPDFDASLAAAIAVLEAGPDRAQVLAAREAFT